MNGTTNRIVLGLGGLVAVTALALTLASSAFAQGPGSGGPGGRFGGPGRAGGPGGPGGPMGRGGRGGPGGPIAGLRGVDLTEAQQSQVKDILDSHRDEQRALDDKMVAAHSALEAAITANPFSEGTVRARAAELALLEADQAVARAAIYSQVFQILTPDQQAKAKQNQADVQKRQEEMRKNRDERRR